MGLTRYDCICGYITGVYETDEEAMDDMYEHFIRKHPKMLVDVIKEWQKESQIQP